MSAVARAPAPAGGDVDPVVAPPPGNPRFPHVDSLRAIAALSILVYHTAYSSGVTGAWYGRALGRLEIGVALFFAISGFLLYRPFFAAHHAGAPRIRTRDYLRRRVLRIVPAYWLALTVLAIYPGLLGVFTGDWWIYYGFGQIYQLDTFVNGIPQAWTLCVEVTFYLALPFYALAMRALCRGRSRRTVVTIELSLLALLALGSLVFRTLAIANGPTVAFAWLPGMFGWFAPGMALAVISVVLQERERPWAPMAAVARHPGLVWLAAGVAFAVLALTVSAPLPTGTIYTEGESFRTYVLSALVAILVLLPAVAEAERGGWPRRFLMLPWLAWLGLISYGIFLWHHTLMSWLIGHDVMERVPGSGFVVLTALTLVLTVTCAAGSYYVVERPILRFKDSRRRRVG
ncbi:MAG TPA: acyltransferase [Thermoleophilaceae bacterium]|nr:acyltransferase [Thermoleophilaceae bacterium]